MKTYEELSEQSLELMVCKQYDEYESKVEAKIVKFSGLIPRKTALWMLFIETLQEVKAVEDIPEFVYTDMNKYDGLKAGRVGKYPNRIADVLIKQKLAEAVN